MKEPIFFEGDVWFSEEGYFEVVKVDLREPGIRRIHLGSVTPSHGNWCNRKFDEYSYTGKRLAREMTKEVKEEEWD